MNRFIEHGPHLAEYREAVRDDGEGAEVVVARWIWSAFERAASSLPDDVGRRWGNEFSGTVFPELMGWYDVVDRPHRDGDA